MNHDSNPRPDRSDAAPIAPATGTFGRRHLLAVGGGSALLAAFLAACGDTTTTTAPGVLGNPPSPVELEPIAPDRVVYLRTLASIELSIAAAYEQLGAVDLGAEPELAAALARFIDDHTAAAAAFNEMAVANGGEVFDCTNPWYDARFIGPLLLRTFGDDGIEPSDNQLRDLRNIVYALEAWESASIHQFLGELGDPVPVARLAVGGSRRAATVALLANPASQNGFVSPALLGDEVPLDADNVVVPFVINSNFGQLVPVPVTVGATDQHGGRFSTALATPADNSFIGPDAICEA